ncbi:MAG: prepilin-type N-terminal cleavage/methylation domain-containing protein [Planctomycetes bacterium]|nr:prepilin-type N-terminal cleavage/methylation domain-containing protein [Planctomycetota bacterium]
MKSLTLPPATVGGAAALRRGFSLIELLIAATIGLVVMGAVASLFGIFGRSASETQSIVDMTNRLRGTALKLRQDLRGITCSITPSLSPESDAGYFELIEGPASDSVDAANNPITAATPILGDTDDVLLFTTRTAGEPFEGKFDTNLILSPVAEVAWFCRPSPPVAQVVAGVSLQTLYRRQLLVVGYVGSAPFSPTNSLSSTLAAAYTRYDLSLRFEPLTNLLVPNTLSDLTQRENRFLHGTQWHVPFPNAFAPATFDAASGREGEDAILTNVIGFDVRVYDPDAIPHLSGSTVVYPNEQGYGGALAAGFKGCFLDLGCAASAVTILSGPGNPRSRLHKINSFDTATYDTWSTHYESNGVNEDSDTDSLVDEATNGLDDNANGLVDDSLENEVPPPYAVPLRAIEVRLRCYDPVSRQVRQTTIRQAFGK